jgi:hypothetical protein
MGLHAIGIRADASGAHVRDSAARVGASRDSGVGRLGRRRGALSRGRARAGPSAQALSVGGEKGYETGSVSLPLALLLMGVMSWSFGVAGLMRQFGEVARLQLSLNDCVREHVHSLRDSIDGVESTNIKMRAVRVAIVAAAMEPATQAALRKSLAVLGLLQQGQRIRWEASRVAWQVRRCGEAALLRGGGGFPWTTPTPDILGPRPLEWTGGECLKLGAVRPPRTAAASLSRDPFGKWSAAWVTPRRLVSGDC